MAGDLVAREEFKPSPALFSPPSYGACPGSDARLWLGAALPPLPFTLSLVLLALGGCGHLAQREAVATNDAWKTSLGGHYGAGGTFGGHREREEGEAKGAMRMGRASFWAAPAWVGRGAVPDGLSPPGQSI